MHKKECRECQKLTSVFFLIKELCLDCYFKSKGFILLSPVPENWFNLQNISLKYYCKEHQRWQEEQEKPFEVNLSKLLRNKTKLQCSYCRMPSRIGITLRQHLRNISRRWVKQSKRYGNNICCITGSTKDIHVHHPFDFTTLYHTLLTELELEIISEDYYMGRWRDDPSFITKIENHWCKILYSHGFGKCLTKKIHKLFHYNKGRKNIDPNQLEELKMGLEQGYYRRNIARNPGEWLSSGIPRDTLLKYLTATKSKGNPTAY